MPVAGPVEGCLNNCAFCGVIWVENENLIPNRKRRVMILDDQELLDRWVSQRDAGAFKDLAKRHVGMVFATCRRILGNDVDAEDATQECFIALIRARREPGSYLGPWLHRVATNMSLKRLRAEKRRKIRESRYEQAKVSSAGDSWKDVLPLVDETIGALPEKQRVAIVAYFLEDKTLEEIADSEGITHPAVAYRIRKGIESVRRSLERRGVAMSAAVLSALFAEQTAVAAPPSLNAVMGKLALSGADAVVYGTSTSAMAKTLGGLVAMKMKSTVVVVILALVVAGVVWFSLGKDPETVPPAIPLVESESREDAPTPSEQVASVSGELAPPGADDGADTDSPIEATDEQARPDAETMEREEQPKEEGEAGASISGHVFDDQGFPIQGAKVALGLRAPTDTSFSFTGERMTGLADTDGFFVFDGVRTGQAYLSASAVGFRNASKRLSIRNGEQHEGLRLVLYPGATLVGRVVSSVGDPIEGAIAQRLAFFSGGGGGSVGDDIYNIAIADEDGLFTMGFKAPGEVTLKVSAPEHGAAVFTAVPVGLEESIEFRIESPASLSGTITHADGTPGANLQVNLLGQFSVLWTRDIGQSRTYTGTSDRLTTTTGGDGRYSFEGLATNTAYIANVHTGTNYHSGAASTALSFDTDLGVFGPGEAHTWDHVLEPMIRVTGSITGEKTGAPITHLRISYIRDGEITEGPFLWRKNTYELRFFEPGAYYIFPEYNSHARPLTIDTYGQEVTLAVGEDREVNFKMPDQFTMSIQVVDASGEPIHGATADWLRITPQGAGMYGSGRTDGMGRHSSSFVPNCESWFHVHKEGYTGANSTHITGEPAAEYPEEVIVLYTTGGLEGIAVDTGGNPISHAQLKIALRAEGVSVDHQAFRSNDFITTTTDGEGGFSIGDGFPAVLGDLYIEASLDNGDWSGTAVVPDVECITDEVVILGAIVFTADAPG